MRMEFSDFFLFESLKKNPASNWKVQLGYYSEEVDALQFLHL